MVMSKLTTIAGFVQIERDAASKVAQAAQADLNQMRQDYESHKAEAEPHRTHRKKLRDHHAVLLVRPLSPHQPSDGQIFVLTFEGISPCVTYCGPAIASMLP
jgi:hypothetical protein